MVVLRFALSLWLASAAFAAEFTFGTMLRAGHFASDWEMTTGASPGDTSQPNANAISTTSPTNYYSNGGWHYFQVGFDGTRGYIRLYDSPTLTSGFVTTSFAASALPSPNSLWTVNGFVTANGPTNNPAKPYTEVAVQNLALGTGLTVIAPPSASLIRANQSGTDAPMTANVPTVTFQSTNTGGAWILSGQVRFVGLSAFTPNGASRSHLQFGLTATSSEVPEPATWLTAVAALAAICTRSSWRRRPRAGAGA